VREAKVFRREEALERRFAELSDRSVRQIVREERIAVVHPAVVTFVSFVGLCALLLAAAWWQRRGAIDAAGLGRFLVLLGLLVAPLQEVMRSFSAVARVTALLQRCQEVLDVTVERDSPSSSDLVDAMGAVEYERVTVEYPGTGFVLGPIELRIAPGETIALVGPSGSGKSTLLELLPRLGEPTRGAVLVDGVDVRELRYSSLRSLCAFVPQEPYFFAGTIRENLLFARPSSDRERLSSACRAAHVEEFVQRLPHGYDTRLERGAANLSVGQRQRLALARAMLVDPKILLLDEPTAALDEESERLLIESLRTFTRGRTTLIVTHSARVVALADRVVHVVAGRAVRVEPGPRSVRTDGAMHSVVGHEG
jgi:ABC-type multidrug transport system fused ATPase/permease subunit